MQAEEQTALDPIAKLTDFTKIPKSTATPSPAVAHIMDGTTGDDIQHQSDSQKVVVKIPAELLANLQSQCDKRALVLLLGRTKGKHPGLQALTTWARETLHSSLVLLSLKKNNVFEVTFERLEGRIHALNQADLMYKSASIFFSSWRPHFHANTPQDTDRLDHLVWMQIVNLCQVLRDDTFLHTIGKQIGQVISIDNSETCRAKLFGPCIRLLVKNLDTLPHMVLPRLDGDGTIEYALEFSGLPNQCGRCRSRDHQVRNCPKKEHPNRHKVCRGYQVEDMSTLLEHTRTPNLREHLIPQPLTRLPRPERPRKINNKRRLSITCNAPRE